VHLGDAGAAEDRVAGGALGGFLDYVEADGAFEFFLAFA